MISHAIIVPSLEVMKLTSVSHGSLLETHLTLTCGAEPWIRMEHRLGGDIIMHSLRRVHVEVQIVKRVPRKDTEDGEVESE